MRFMLQSTVLVLTGVLSAPLSAQVSAASDEPAVQKAYSWVDLSACKRPKRRPPAVPAEDYEEYNFERRFLALEPGRPCIVMDSFIERLFGSSSPGMRTLGTRKYRFENGKWVHLPLIFPYFPYAIRRLSDGRVFYIVAMLQEDVGDNMVASSWSTDVFTLRADGTQQRDFDPIVAIDTAEAPHGEMLQGLAVVLSSRLRLGLLKPASAEHLDRERKRIRRLLKTAWETVPPANRVAVDAEGLPR